MFVGKPPLVQASGGFFCPVLNFLANLYFILLPCLINLSHFVNLTKRKAFHSPLAGLKLGLRVR